MAPSLTNATVARCLVDSCLEAIGLRMVSNSTVEGNRCSYSGDGLYLDTVSMTSFANDTCDQNNMGVYAYALNWTSFANCTFPYNTNGMYIETSENVTSNPATHQLRRRSVCDGYLDDDGVQLDVPRHGHQRHLVPVVVDVHGRQLDRASQR